MFNFSSPIGDVSIGVAEIAPAGASVTNERGEAVDFLLPIIHGISARFFIKTPTHSSNWKAYIQPLSHQTWMIGLAFILFLPIFMVFMFKVEEPTDSNHLDLVESIGMVGGAFSNKGSARYPSSSKHRILFFSIFACGILFYYHWEAMLISYLSAPSLHYPFANVIDLMENTQLKVTHLQNQI